MRGTGKFRLKSLDWVTNKFWLCRVWDIVPVAIQQEVQYALLQCIQSICRRTESSESEKNSLCKTVAFIHEFDATRGHGWPQLDECLQELVSHESSWSKRELYYKFIYASPAMVADTPVPDLMSNIQSGLQAIPTASLSISAMEAAIAIFQADDRATKMSPLMSAILEVTTSLLPALSNDFKALLFLGRSFHACCLPKRKIPWKQP